MKTRTNQTNPMKLRTWPWLGTTLKASIVVVMLGVISLSSCIVPASAGSSNCPPGCTCDDVALVVKCNEGTLDVFPNTLSPFIQRLMITNNKKIRTIDSSIQFYAVLTYLDLSFNELVNLPPRTFKFQTQLRELNLSHNKIGEVNNRTFIGLSAVTVLNLRGNLIAELERSSFTSVTKVEELNLGENRISSIDPLAFDGLDNLRVLYLDDNTLTTVPAPLTFEMMPRLAELFLGTNSFERLPPGAFATTEGLTRLDLRSAGLVRNLTVDALKGLDGLRVLDLSDNRLQEIPTAALAHLQRLEELSLGQNDFERLPANAFQGLKNLRRLEVTGAARLERIASGAFADNANLEFLNFSGNKMLSVIEENALRGLPHLRHVILRENQLSTLGEGLFPWDDLETLDLADNPFVCDCHVLWLHKMLVTANATGSNLTQSADTGHLANVVCHFPERFRGKSLPQLTTNELGCTNAAGTGQPLISVLIVVIVALIVIGLLIIVSYTCRHRIRDTLKGGFGKSALGRKEREYQKTFSDDEYMTRQQHPCMGLGVHLPIATAPYTNGDSYNTHNPGYMGSRPIPVTEL